MYVECTTDAKKNVDTVFFTAARKQCIAQWQARLPIFRPPNKIK